MTHQLCLASHRDNPPPALGGLKLCAGHHAVLEEALTGPSAAEDPTIDCAWGVRSFAYVITYESRHTAYLIASDSYLGGKVVCGDGAAWYEPQNYRPGGLARDYIALTLRLTGQTTGDRLPCIVHATEAPLPMSEAVAELRSQIRHDLGYWAGCHIEAGIISRLPADASPTAIVAWLAIHRDWAAAQDWAGDYVAVLGELRAKARRLIDLPRAPRVDVGTCPEYGCGGLLRSEIREEYDPRPSLVRCDACGRDWDSTQWTRLGPRVLKANGGTAA